MRAPFYGPAQAQCHIHTITCSLKSGCDIHFNRESSCLQAGDEDSQVPCPLFNEFLLQVIVQVRAVQKMEFWCRVLQSLGFLLKQYGNKHYPDNFYCFPWL